MQELVVTGSRIPRADLTGDQPVSVLAGQSIRDRGFSNLADAVNQSPIAGVPISPTGDQNDFGTGRNYINLFNLGTQRTLTLVDGKRFVGDNPTSLFGPEAGNQVDLNALPTLFVDRVETVPATGAAVYGSDAVAGVVNIRLKQTYRGAKALAQAGLSDRGDAPRYTGEVAFGGDLLGGRLNVAVDAQYDRTNTLTYKDRPRTAAGYSFAPNPADTGPGDGVPGTVLIGDTRFSGVTTGGLPFTLDGGQVFLPGTTTPVQFGPSGELVPFNPGTLYGSLYGGAASGGDSLSNSPLTALQTAVDRKVVSAIGTFAFTPHLHAHANFSYAQAYAREPANLPNYATIAFGASPAGQPIPGLAVELSPDDVFLTSQARAILDAATGGGDFLLSRANVDLSPAPVRSLVETLNGSLEFDGDFAVRGHAVTWTASYTRGRSDSTFDQDNIVFGNPAYGVANRFGYALDAVAGPGGQPVCRVTLENPGSADPAIAGCAPLNPFGVGNASAAALSYVTNNVGFKARNSLDDAQANLSASLARLPAGDAKVSLGYEYRRQQASFTPDLAAQEGIGFGIPLSPQRGADETNEYYLEGLLPVFGPQFNLPFLYRLEFDGAYRKVGHSVSGDDEAWSYGGRYSPIRDVTFRASRSRTFRAPAITELFSSGTQAYDFGADPCQASNITAGSNPATRQANCAAAFASLGANLGGFTFSNVGNFSIPITAEGNPQLKSETGRSYTWGVVLQPRFVPGLSLTADYVHIDVTNAIEFLGLGSLLALCYDTPGYPAATCGQFTREAGTGQVTRADETYINAGYIRFAGESFALTYDRPVNALPFVHPNRDLGRLDLSFNAFHTRRNITSASGLGYDVVNIAGQIGSPRWRWTADLRYRVGKVQVGWTTQFIEHSLYDQTFTLENQSILRVGDYYRHDLSIQYNISPSLTARLNVNDITDAEPPFPIVGINVYDQVGRYFLLQLDGRF